MENEQIRKAGLKVTLPRVKILTLLEQSDKRHVSAEDVYKNLLKQGDEIIEERQRITARQHGFAIQDHSLVIYGICGDPACRN